MATSFTEVLDNSPDALKHTGRHQKVPWAVPAFVWTRRDLAMSWMVWRSNAHGSEIFSTHPDWPGLLHNGY